MDCLVRMEDGAGIGRILWIIWEVDIDERDGVAGGVIGVGGILFGYDLGRVLAVVSFLFWPQERSKGKKGYILMSHGGF